MRRYRTPIVNIAEHVIPRQPRLTQSIVSAWIARMIDAGWQLSFDGEVMFVHADEYRARITHELACELVKRYWKRLDIPSPHNYEEVAKRPLVRADIEAPPLGAVHLNGGRPR